MNEESKQTNSLSVPKSSLAQKKKSFSSKNISHSLKSQSNQLLVLPKVSKQVNFKYSSSIYHKNIFHVIPDKNNPQFFEKVRHLPTEKKINPSLPIKRIHTEVMQHNHHPFKHSNHLNNILKASLSHLTPIKQSKYQKLEINTVKRKITDSKDQKSDINKIINKNNFIIPHPVSIRQCFTKVSGLETSLAQILEDDNKILVTAKKWIIYDMKTGLGIKGYKHKKQHDIASISKIITFHTAYKIIKDYYLGLDQTELIVTQEDQNISGSKISLKKDYVVTLGDMLYALMLNSANNAATVIANNLASLVKKKKQGKYFSCYDVLNENRQRNLAFFVELMQESIKQLGLSSETKVINPHGMCKNVSTSIDVAKMTAECFKLPLFSQIVNTKTKTIHAQDINELGQVTKRPILLQNTNKLLWEETGCVGGKTGCNSIGGQSLTACYEGRIIVVVLGCMGKQQKFLDAQRLLQWLRMKLSNI